MKEAQVAFKWILNPFLDLMFCCGGLVWVLFVVQDLILDRSNSQLAAATAMFFVAISQFLGDAHISATLFRIYARKELRSRYKPFTCWYPLLGLFLLLAGLLNPAITAFLLKIYLLWVFQHFTGQTYGLMLIYCYKSKYPISCYDKWLLAFVLNTLAAVAIIRQLSQSSWVPSHFLGQTLPVWNLVPEPFYFCSVALLQVSVLLLAIQICKKCFTQRAIFPLSAIFMLFTIVATIVLNQNIASSLWLYLPAFFHASQYLAITCSQHLKESLRDTSADQIWKLLASVDGIRYFTCLSGLVLGLYVLVPNLLQLTGASRELVFASVVAVLNLHHFVTDMSIWKIRDRGNEIQSERTGRSA